MDWTNRLILCDNWFDEAGGYFTNIACYVTTHFVVPIVELVYNGIASHASRNLDNGRMQFGIDLRIEKSYDTEQIQNQ